MEHRLVNAPQPVQPRLVSLMEGLAAPLLGPAEREEFLAVFDRLTRLAFNSRQDPARRSQLCYDGTPLEMSIALDNAAKAGLRFVADVAAGLPGVPAEKVADQLRQVAASFIPDFPGRAETLDRMFSIHLAGRRPDSRFLVWYGAGAAPGKKLLGKLYFNSEWLSADDIRTLLAPHVPADVMNVCLEPPAATGSYYKCVAYDYDGDGLRNIKLYLQPGEEDPAVLFDLFEKFPEAGGGRLRELFEFCFGTTVAGGECPFALVLGVKFAQDGKTVSFEPKVYVHLNSWGYATFAAVAPLLRRLLARWGYDPIGIDLETGPKDFEPTLMGIAVAAQREGLALYFKPNLPMATGWG